MHADITKITKAYAQSESPIPAEFTPDQRACLQSLHFAEMYWRRNDIVDPAPATCAWILDHTRYHKWLDQGHGLLWIKGNPGSGKSTVLKHILETAEREPKQKSISASFFFHGRGAPIQRNVLGLFRSLLHQILQQNRALLSDLTSLYNKKIKTEGQYGIDWTWNENQLQSFFKSNVVHMARTHQTRVYIDALDECGQDIALELVEFFRWFAVPISICFSCRHYPFVALEGGNEICVEDENEQDIHNYVQDKIKAHIQSTDIAEAVQIEVVSRSNGNFQWVVLVMPRVLKLFKSRQSKVTILTTIRSIPAELSELYTDILDGIEEHERAQSLHFMQWTCFALRPLTLTELRFALAVTADTPYTSISQCQSSKCYVKTDEDMQLRIRDLSKGLAEVLENNGTPIVQFIHQSVTDFLLEKGLQILDISLAGVVAGGSHFCISRSCIKLFHMQEVQKFASCLDHMALSELDKVEKPDYFALLDYSAIFWPLHAAKVEDSNISQGHLAALASEPPDGILLSWFSVFQRFRFRFVERYQFLMFHCHETLLHVASRHNLISIVKGILTQNVWADQPNGYHQTSLSIAASEGHEVIVKLLLNRNDIDANHKDSWGDTPLSLATTRGHKAVIEMLIDWKDTNINLEIRDGDTPLSVAARNGHDEIVRILLERGVNLDSKNGRQRSPLLQAAKKGHYRVVKLLLQHNADVHARDERGQTPLSVAAANGQPSVVELLLQHNADIEARDHRNQTPLFHAAFNGHYKVVKLLLQHNADIEARDDKFQTPLFRAAANDQPSVLELLLQHNANIEARDHRNQTPLFLAAFDGYYKVVELLLQKTSNVNSIDVYGRTPLSHASGDGYKETVKLFVGRSDVDVNLKDRIGRSPLSWALACGSSFSLDKGYLDIVDLLLSRHDITVSEEDKAALRLFWMGRKSAELTSVIEYGDNSDAIVMLNSHVRVLDSRRRRRSCDVQMGGMRS